MALDPNAFSPDAQNDSQQPNQRRQRMSTLLGGKASLGSLFDSGSDTSGLSKSSLNGGETSSPLATPGLGAAEPAGSPSLLSTERVQGAPNFGTASPLLTGEQQAGAELGEAARGEEGVIGGGAGRQGLSTADRNRALMSFFHPQAAAGNAPEAPQGASDTMKAVGSAKSAVSGGSKLKSLFAQSAPGVTFSGDSWSGSDWGLPDKFTPGGLTAHEQIGAPPTGTPEQPDQFGVDPSSAPAASTRDATGTAPGSTDFGLPDFTKLGTYGAGVGLLGNLFNVVGGAGGNKDLADAGRAASAAGSGVSLASNLASGTAGLGDVSSGLGLLGAGLQYAGQQSKNEDVSKAGQASSAAGAGASLVGGLTPLAPLALPTFVKSVWDMVEPDKTRYGMVRDAANLQGQNEVGGLKNLAESIPDGNMGATYAALRSQLDPQGKVGTYFNPEPGVADQLGVPQGARWNQMTPQQFSAVMDWMREDPTRVSAITGSGDIGYLPQDQAQSYGNQAADVARQLVARQLGTPYLRPDQESNPDNVASFMAQRDKWGAAHPGVALTPYAPPKNYNPSPSLLDLYQSMTNNNTL